MSRGELRSLALRPRLATGLPWTDDLRMADLAFAGTVRAKWVVGL